MRLAALAATMCLLAAAASTAWCEEAVKSTFEERAKFLEGAKAYEQDPLSDKAKEFHAWALKWLGDVEDIMVSVDEGIVVPLAKDMPEDCQRPFLAQFVITCGVYAIENGEKEDDPVARNVQALESCLRTYHAILKANPDARNDAVEEVDKLAAEKKLESYVKEKLAEENEAREGEDEDDDEGAE